MQPIYLHNLYKNKRIKKNIFFIVHNVPKKYVMMKNAFLLQNNHLMFLKIPFTSLFNK